eukprot:TRINITY_DN8368_c0_g1_i1.p1 TRINITY_DN8368_c0_g1~~TRINITY_DN8368_c0_g1_i1.p1  ORF type:complete len:276 (+),score=65.29 TRINITY_DN8368_c0_g1_i1:62-889(+)
MADVDLNRIINSKNYYDTLGVSRTATEDEIKRAYRKLAVVTHPDKNSNPRAEEAFKVVGKAFATLSDPQKRATYDRYGEEGMQRMQGRSEGGEPMPEDIYDLFAQMFGADPRMQGRQFHYRRAQRPHPQQEQPRVAAQLFQILPLLLFFLVYFLFSFGSSDSVSPYSLTFDQAGQYIKKRTTKDHKIPYYVQPTFGRDVARDPYALRDVEGDVYASYKSYLNRRCKFEQREKYMMRQRASLYYTGKKQKEMMDKADSSSTSSCDELNDLISKFGY